VALLWQRRVAAQRPGEPELEHIEFWWARPKEYEKRVVAFFDQYLLGS
jgi:hypothetical protein